MRFFRSDSSSSRTSAKRSSFLMPSRRSHQKKFGDTLQPKQQEVKEIDRKKKTEDANGAIVEVRGDSQLSTTSDSSFSSSSVHSDSFSRDCSPSNTQDSSMQHKSRPSSDSNRSDTSSTVKRTSCTSSSNSPSTGRTSLASFSQLTCSMSYKNRNQISRPFTTSSVTSIPASIRRSTSNTTRSTTSSSGTFISDLDPLQAQRHSYSEHLIQEPHCKTPSSSSSPRYRECASTSNLRVLCEMKYTEANMTALQTRRAFQQMVLSMHEIDQEEEEEEEDEEEGDLDAGLGLHGNGNGNDNDGERSSSIDSMSSAFGGHVGGVVQVNMEDYRKFQFRLRQLEELCTEQAKKQAMIEETIEKEVELRTKTIVKAMEKKMMTMYKPALHQQKRFNETTTSETSVSSSSLHHSNNDTTGSRHSYNGRRSSSSSTSTSTSSTSRSRSSSSSSSSSSSKRLDRILHPRRSKQRRRLEMEEQQRREMEQFREFLLHTAESHTNSLSLSHQNLDENHLYENCTKKKLINMVTVLRQHVSIQDAQLEEAKKLINAAIEAREEAESTARDAVELTLELDSRLERASHEIVVLRRSTLKGEENMENISRRNTSNGSILDPTSDSFTLLSSTSIAVETPPASLDQLPQDLVTTTSLRNNETGPFDSERNLHSTHRRLSSESGQSLLVKAT